MSKRFWQIIAGALLVSAAAAAMFVYGADSFEQQSPTEVSSSLPDSISQVLAPDDQLTADEVREGDAWEPSDYSDQKDAMGWSPTVFDVSEGLKTRVDFWKKIYSKYSTDQGVLHDPVTFEIYDVVDFEPYRDGQSITRNARIRQKLVDVRKTEIIAKLKLAEPEKYAKEAARIRFQLGQRDKVLHGIYYSGRYLKAMEKIFRERGLPIELTRLPFVESSFNTKARSKVGASGIWQFMRRTARGYLKINSAIDERNDPLFSTEAAAKLMKSNYNMLGSWPLAVTAWNHGPSGVRNISQKLGTQDIAEIVNTYTSRTFGFASQNFYACFLAVLDVEHEARTHFKKPVWQPEIDATEVKAPRFIAWPTVVELFGDDEQLAQEYNPHLNQYARSSSARIPAGTRLRIPAEQAELAKYTLAGKKPPKPKPTPKPTSSPKSSSEDN